MVAAASGQTMATTSTIAAQMMAMVVPMLDAVGGVVVLLLVAGVEAVGHAPSPGRQSVGPVQALPRLAASVSTV